MKSISKTLLAPCLLLLLGTVLLGKVTTDYDHDTDFSKFRTFSWIREPNMKSPLMKDRVVDFVNAQLSMKSLSMVANNGDIGIAAHGATEERHSLQTFYDGWDGGWGWRRTFGPPVVTTTVDTYEVGTLVIDLFDSHTKEVVWRGTATQTLSDEPEKNTKKLEDAVQDMFKKFPPKDTGKGN